MQLFSRKRTLAALSLGALVALGACGDDVQLTEVPPVETVTITPPSANMNVGESLNFAVTITGGNATTPPTLTSCTSSNAAVATAAVTGSACRVTALTAGNITVTAQTSGNKVAAASVTVAAPAASINTLTVSPSSSSLAVNQTVTIESCAVAHGNLSVVVNTEQKVSQPNPLAGGQTVTTTQSEIDIKQGGGSLLQLKAGVKLSDVVKAINALGAGPQDLLSILQSMKAAGALRADLEII